MADEVELTSEGHTALIAFIEDEAHHLRQRQDGVFGLLWVNIHQCMDVVQRVHKKVRVDLIFQILQLLLQVLLLQSFQLLLVVAILEE